MTAIVTVRARAYVYAGMWVAECPRVCGNVEALFDLANPADPRSARTRRKNLFLCSYCAMLAEIDWADGEEDIMAVLDRRPIPHNRNWYPVDHRIALEAGLPHGQTIADLEAENREHGVV